MSVPISAEINLDADSIDIFCDYHDADRVKALPGAKVRNDPATRSATWYFPISWSAGYALRNTFPLIQFGDNLNSWMRWYHETMVVPAFSARYSMDGPAPFGATEERAAYLRPYQRAGVEFLTTVKRGILADDMGTGKTEQTLEMVETMHRKHVANPDANASPFPCIVVTPASVKFQWRKAWNAQYPERVIGVADGNAKKRREVIQQLKDGDIDVLVINYENVWRHSRLAPYGSVMLRRCEVCDPDNARGQKQPSCHYCLGELNTDGLIFGSVVADEAHVIKNPTSSTTRAVWWLSHKQLRPGGAVIPLTGTPTESQLDDYWSLLHLVRPEEFPVKSKFMDRFALMVPQGDGGLKPAGVNPMTRDEFYAVTEYLMLRRPKEVVLPFLPPKVFTERTAILSPKQLKSYRMVEKELMVRGLAGEEGGEGLERPAIEPAVAALRLQQAAAATLDVQTCETCTGSGEASLEIAHTPQGHPDPAFTTTHCWCARTLEYAGPEHQTGCRSCSGWGDTIELIEPSAKIDELMNELDGDLAGRQLVIFYVHRRLGDLLAARLDKRKKETYFRYDGSTNAGEREVGMRQFGIGEIDLALVSIDAGGTGVDGLQVAGVAVYLQRHSSRIKNSQSEDRTHRIGATGDSVLYVDIVADVPIEAESSSRMSRKDDAFEDVVNDAETVRRLLRK